MLALNEGTDPEYEPCDNPKSPFLLSLQGMRMNRPNPKSEHCQYSSSIHELKIYDWGLRVLLLKGGI